MAARATPRRIPPRSPALRGDELPHLVAAPPGPRSREIAAALARYEAPGANTLFRGKPSLIWESARGANVADVDGNIFLDLTAGFGVAAVGHRHPSVIAALRRQAGRLLHGLGDVHGHPLRACLAHELASLAPMPEPKVFFAVSGAEAVEIALKTALLATGRPGVLVFDPAYHGLTLGALAATSREEFRRPFAAHLSPHFHRLPFGAPLDAVDGALSRHQPGCVLVEPVVGREGTLFPPVGWLAGVAARARAHGALFVADEIFTGFGRTGAWFAVNSEEVIPDLLCCGKALAGGMPLAAVIGRSECMDVWKTDGEAIHTSTFLAHPLACAAALASLDVLRSENLLARASELGQAVARRISEWRGFDHVLEEARGRGLLWGFSLRTSRLASRWAEEALARGVIVLAGGADGRVVQLSPALTITPTQLDAALALLEEALRAATAQEAGLPA